MYFFLHNIFNNERAEKGKKKSNEKLVGGTGAACFENEVDEPVEELNACPALMGLWVLFEGYFPEGVLDFLGVVRVPESLHNLANSLVEHVRVQPKQHRGNRRPPTRPRMVLHL